ncbi:monooxygenase family protein [Aeromicrobium terrae]|uniref:DUF4188 domain-containing protein n=1 Tax=Aeromicrobium terrae TaxID=2498846 RepID=A0A5C8NFC1_9ACTN|nr:DUF4188 domain-containing protein [Aeromicrobium terrae]TXL57613.1 DUF4188 domain-containing protein [Aeromicrobium terrae]
MGKTIHEGRQSVQIDGDFIVFIIGARLGLRGLRAVRLLSTMRKMLKEVEENPEIGLLGFHQHGGPFGVIVQYWRSFDDLERYSRSMERLHRPVWLDWYRRKQDKNRHAGIWHETYAVRAGEYEAVYQNMPDIGLMKAGRVFPVGSGSDTARTRIGR